MNGDGRLPGSAVHDTCLNCRHRLGQCKASWRRERLSGPEIGHFGAGLRTKGRGWKVEEGPSHPGRLLYAAAHIESGWSRRLGRGLLATAVMNRGLAEVAVQPDLRRSRITLRVDAAATATFRAEIEGTGNAYAGPPGDVALQFPEHETWSTAHPVLYTLRCSLEPEEGAANSRTIRFGMREFTVKEDRFALNQRPVYLCGLNLGLEGPGGAAREELVLAKEAGFNIVRLGPGADLEASLEIADELGLLVCVVFGSGQASRDVLSVVRSLRNHASLVAWSLRGEDPGLARQVHAEDRSRVVLFEAARSQQEPTDSILIRPYRDGPEPFDPLELRLGIPNERAAELCLEHCGEPQTVSLVTVYAGACDESARGRVAASGAVEDRQSGESRRGEVLARNFDTPDDFDRAAQSLAGHAAASWIDAIRSNGKLAGYWYDGAAGRTEAAAELRRKGPIYLALQSAQAPVRPLIHVPRRNLTPRQEVPVLVTLANELRLDGRADLSLQVLGPTNQVLWKKRRGVKIPRHGRELWSGSIAASGSTGAHRFVVRLIREGAVLGEASIHFDVFDAAAPWDGEVHVLDPQGRWSERCAALAAGSDIQAPIHIVPPLVNTIRGYPSSELAQVLAQVKEGAVALFFHPPADWNDLAAVLEPRLGATSVCCGAGTFHYARLHPVFDGLPARGLMGWAYHNVAPHRVFLEAGEEDICGCISRGTGEGAESPRWGNGILIRRYGAGRIVFVHLPILEHLGSDPVADGLFVNLLRHFSRRSVAADSASPIHQQALEWLRRERAEKVQRWRVVGLFPNWGGTGHETAYPPEEELDFDATYPGWYRAIYWKDWSTTSSEDHVLDLGAATSSAGGHAFCDEAGTAYAYAELIADQRGAGTLVVEGASTVNVWMNKRIVHATEPLAVRGGLKPRAVEVHFRQGRNALLLKASSRKAPLRVRVAVAARDGAPTVRWWS